MPELTMAGGALAAALLWAALWEYRQHNFRDARLLAALGSTGGLASLAFCLA